MDWPLNYRSNPMKTLSLRMGMSGALCLTLLGSARPASLPQAELSTHQMTTVPHREAARPPAQAARGIPFGPWAIPPHLIGPLYSGGVLSGPEPYAKLDEVRARKGEVVLYLARKRSIEGGLISVAAAQRFLETWPDITPYIRDGTVWGIIVSDDITGKRIWGPDAPYYPQIDSIAKLVKDRWPEARTIVRAAPAAMTYPWKWVDWAWSQYSNVPRNGNVTNYRDRQMAKADSLGLCLVFGLNIIHGGDGSSGKGLKRRHLMSGAEFLRYYSVLLPHTPLAFHWQYRPEVEAEPDLRAAMEQVRAWADTMPRPTCRYERRD
jgi:hypothetical protein